MSSDIPLTPTFVKTVGFGKDKGGSSPNTPKTNETKSQKSNKKKEKSEKQTNSEPNPSQTKMSKEERKALYEKQAKEAAERKKQTTSQTGQTPPQATQSQKSTQPPTDIQLARSGSKEKAQQPSDRLGTTPPKKEIVKTPKPVPAVKQFDAKSKTKTVKKGSLFAHLPKYESVLKNHINSGFPHVHPAILEFGLKMASGEIKGSNARCLGMLEAFSKMIEDFSPKQEYLTGDVNRDFDIKTSVKFLVECRPLSVSMRNSINALKGFISKAFKEHETFEEAKTVILENIDKFIHERIVVAGEMIANFAESKIVDGDVILTYARSCVVEMTLKQAKKNDKKFKVIIVDSKPKFEGKELLRRLVKEGINCTYVLINSLSFVMKEVTKVFVGAYTMMANGNLLSRIGTALTAMMAHAYQVPFIVCCETYKFTERVQLESISFNELGDPEELIRDAVGDDQEALAEEDSKKQLTLKNWREFPNLMLLNLIYDLTPTEFITMVITEVGMVPATSVQVIIREFSAKEQMSNL